MTTTRTVSLHHLRRILGSGSPRKMAGIAARRIVARMKSVSSTSFRTGKPAGLKHYMGDQHIAKRPTIAVLAPEVGPLHALVRVNGTYQHINPGQSFPLGGTSNQGVSVAFHPVVVHGAQALGVSGPGAFIERADGGHTSW